MKWAWLLVIALVWILAILSHLKAAPNPDGTLILNANAVVDAWFTIESCTGIVKKNPVKRIVIFPSRTFRIRQDDTTIEVMGYWREADNTVFLPRYYKDSAWLVKHELMHALLNDGSHPLKYFRRVCGDLMHDHF